MVRQYMNDDGGGVMLPKKSAAFDTVKTLQPIQTVSSPSSFQKTAGAYIAPVSNYVAPAYTGPVSSTPTGGIAQGTWAQNNPNPSGGGGMSSALVSRPRDYSSFSDAEASTDSVFMDQKSAYANALKKFIEDNDRQKGVLETDAATAQQGIARNRTNGLTGLSEDFASRGLSNSGMFRQELDNADGQYGKQKEQVTMGLKNAKDDLGFRRAKYEQENGENGTNIQAARREAFARLAASQGLT